MAHALPVYEHDTGHQLRHLEDHWIDMGVVPTLRRNFTTINSLFQQIPDTIVILFNTGLSHTGTSNAGHPHHQVLMNDWD